MTYISQYQYYENGGVIPEDKNWGSYQYISLEDVVNNFMLIKTGNHSLVNNENRFKILFYAKEAIKELNYDALKEIKALELSVDDSLRFVLPSDYVNWVRISMYKDGVLYPLSENRKVMSADAYLQDNTGKMLFDADGNILRPEFSGLDYDRIVNSSMSTYTGSGMYSGSMGYFVGGNWYFNMSVGARFGLNPEEANINPSFVVDKKRGVINFSSSIGKELVVLEYVSDGMENGDNSLISVNKLFEKYIYAEIKFNILDNKEGVQEYKVRRARKERTALLRNAKIRMSNIHPGRLLMSMRGASKFIK
jgi:hypothetical protein